MTKESVLDTRVSIIVPVHNASYIAFLDADDVWLPEKLERELEFMEKEGASFVFMSYEFGDENAKPTGKIVHVPDRLDYKHAFSRTVIFTSTTLFDTRHLDKKLIYMPLIEKIIRKHSSSGCMECLEKALENKSKKQ